jgi:hypothetical protein
MVEAFVSASAHGSTYRPEQPCTFLSSHLTATMHDATVACIPTGHLPPLRAALCLSRFASSSGCQRQARCPLAPLPPHRSGWTTTHITVATSSPRRAPVLR